MYHVLNPLLASISKYPMLAPREAPLRYSPLVLVSLGDLSNQKLVIEASYSNEDNKKQEVYIDEVSFDTVKDEAERRLYEK